MRLDAAAVDNPVIRRAVCDDLVQFICKQRRRHLKLRDMVGGLQVVKPGVIIDSILAGLAARHRVHTRIVVALTAGEHPAKAVVRPDFHHAVGDFQRAAAVQVHHFAIEVGAELRVRLHAADDFHLPPHNAADLRAPLFVGVEGVVLAPERAVALPTKADGVNHLTAFVFLSGLAPELLEFLRIEPVGTLQFRPAAAEHLRAEKLRMMLGENQPHVGGQHVQPVAVTVCAGDNHIAAAAQDGFKHHPPYLAMLGLPLLPGIEQHLVVDEPAAIFHRISGRFHHAAGHFRRRHGRHGLIVPVP